MSAQERLAAWANEREPDQRTVTLRARPDMYANGITFWKVNVIERGPVEIEVEVGPCSDPESACSLAIERLAAAGVVVP